jgi:quercetin dioxygenase-like cupin family protein
MNVHEPLRGWLVEAAGAAIDRAACSEIEEGAATFRRAIEVAAAVPFRSQSLPVLRNLEQVGGSPRAEQFVEFAPHLRWVESHRWDDQGEERALCVLSEAFELPGLEVGIMYVDQGCTYPLHSHPPQELYLIVSGSAHWRYGGSEELVEMAPSSTLYNNPLDLHTVEAGDTPLVAMYVLWGNGVRS